MSTTDAQHGSGTVHARARKTGTRSSTASGTQWLNQAISSLLYLPARSRPYGTGSEANDAILARSSEIARSWASAATSSRVGAPIVRDSTYMVRASLA